MEGTEKKELLEEKTRTRERVGYRRKGTDTSTSTERYRQMHTHKDKRRHRTTFISRLQDTETNEPRQRVGID